MNSFIAHIESIKTSGSLSIVKLKASGILFQSVLLETPNTVNYLKVNNEIKVLFKETEVAIGLQTDLPISLGNRVEGIIQTIEQGELLSRVCVVTALGEINSLITTDSLINLELEIEKNSHFICENK